MSSGASTLASSAQARRLRSILSRWDFEFDNWIDNLGDGDIDYLYNLMINGRMDDVVDAFQWDRSRGNSHAKWIIGDDAEYYYYYSGTGGNDVSNAWPLPLPWDPALDNPWDDNLDPGLERAHVVDKATLRDFYRGLVELSTNFPETLPEIKTALEPLFEAIKAKMPEMEKAVLRQPWKLIGGKHDLLLSFKKYIQNDETLSLEDRGDAETLFRHLYIWAPGNLVYAPKGELRA